jgi:glycosyltransferase involved in cell wall biosynthesis
MQNRFPIAVRTRNRPVYLDVTLKSLWASQLPDDADIIVIDDCSDDPEALRHLNTDEKFKLEKPCTWLPEGHPKWEGYVGRIADVNSLNGLKSRIEVVRPERKKGVRGCLFWGIDYMMTRFPDAEGIIMIEADIVFNAEWYTATCHAYDRVMLGSGPNGPDLGLLTAYDRKGKTTKKGANDGCVWRGVTKRADGRWNCINGIGGVMYVVTRSFYEHSIGSFKKIHPASSRGGDTMIQGFCANANHSIAATVPSYCQHIGITSLAWPEKGWRHTTNFIKPMSFESFIDDGKTAYSVDWD